MRTQDGFLGRVPSRKHDSEWLDIVSWRDQAAVDAVMPNPTGSDVYERCFACMTGADHEDSGAGATLRRHVRS